MTVVAYRNGIIAADTLMTTEGLKVGNVRKVVKTSDGCLAGVAGTIDYCAEFLAWAQTDREYPAPKYNKDSEAILIDASGKIHYYCGKQHIVILDAYMAIGCGAPYALAAMYVGADAKDAVDAAMHLHTNCGGRIMSESLS